MTKLMKQSDVLDLLELFEGSGITACVDGGWGVDALLGRQTRDHDDLDIAVQHKDVPKLRKLLAAKGFNELARNDSTDYMFVLRDQDGREVDVHAYTFDEHGNHSYGIEYPAQALTGEGAIGGRVVHCIAPEYVIKFHTAYEPTQKDYDDVKLLCEKFNIALPDMYKKFVSN